MDSALTRCFESLRSRRGALPAAGAVCAGAALAAAGWFGGSAAGILAACAAGAGWLIWIRRRAAVSGSGAALRLVSSIALPGGGRVHELRCGGRTLVVGCGGGRVDLLDARADGEGDA